MGPHYNSQTSDCWVIKFTKSKEEANNTEKEKKKKRNSVINMYLIPKKVKSKSSK